MPSALLFPRLFTVATLSFSSMCVIRNRIIEILNDLPESALREVASFAEYQKHKVSASADASDKPVAIKLGDLFAGIEITDEDIAAVRQEMWGGIEDRMP